MNANVLNNTVETAKAFGQLNAATVNKVVNVQVANVKDNAELAVSNLKAGLGVRDYDAARDYLTSQTNVARTVIERFVADSKALAGIVSDYGNEAAKLVKPTA